MAASGWIGRARMNGVFAAGTFDLFHAGHVNFLRQCAEFGPVTVALNTDEFAARYKRPPIMTLAERAAVVGACLWVRRVMVNSGGEDARPAILDADPLWVAHGSDWKGDALMKQLGLTQEWLDEHGIKLLYLPYTEGVSSSEIIRRIEASGTSRRTRRQGKPGQAT